MAFRTGLAVAVAVVGITFGAAAWTIFVRPAPALGFATPLKIVPGIEAPANRGLVRHLGPIDAASAAQRLYGGRVLDVRPDDGGFRVKLLADGDVRVVFIAGT
jgi:hypothetical protein